MYYNIELCYLFYILYIGQATDKCGLHYTRGWLGGKDKKRIPLQV